MLSDYRSDICYYRSYSVIDYERRFFLNVIIYDLFAKAVEVFFNLVNEYFTIWIEEGFAKLSKNN